MVNILAPAPHYPTRRGCEGLDLICRRRKVACQLGVGAQAHRGCGFQYRPTIGLWQRSPSLLVQLHTAHNQLASKVLEDAHSSWGKWEWLGCYWGETTLARPSRMHYTIKATRWVSALHKALGGF